MNKVVSLLATATAPVTSFFSAFLSSGTDTGTPQYGSEDKAGAYKLLEETSAAGENALTASERTTNKVDNLDMLFPFLWLDGRLIMKKWLRSACVQFRDPAER